MRGLILDLRFNPGGLLAAAIEVSDLFIATGRIVSTKGRNSPERVWDAQKEGTFDGFPMVVLVNRYSASASEIVAACLQDHKRAVIVGERTWGKGSVQNVIELEDGHSALKLTTAGYRRPSGKNIHRFPDAKESDEWGVMPDNGYEVKLQRARCSRWCKSGSGATSCRRKPSTKPEAKADEAGRERRHDETGLFAARQGEPAVAEPKKARKSGRTTSAEKQAGRQAAPRPKRDRQLRGGAGVPDGLNWPRAQ